MLECSRIKILRFSLFLLFLSLQYGSNGQVNLKVGYNFGYADLEQSAAIFERYNEDNPQAEKFLTPINKFHGIDLGLRYKFKNIGIDLGLSSTSGSSEALNVMLSNGSLGKNEWRTSLLNYSVGLEYFIGNWGYGASIGTQKLTYKTDFTSGAGKKTVFDESVLASRFYLILEVPSNKIAFSIRPYISTTWSPYNVQDVELEFNSQSSRPSNEFDMDILVYGISFSFYNGSQN
ncbi:MAG: hypothetical protein P1U56_12245 [Saprospiraceae bacterium]|nr:hypothetical protein [Saprospiraceae bacterium]